MQTSVSVLSSSPPKNTNPTVTVATTARVHFGFLDPSGRTNEPFGSFGLSLDQPWTRLTLSHGDEEISSGPEAVRAARYLKTIAGAHGLDHTYRLEIAEAIPSHAGLGSGTQLALAVGAAFCTLEGLDVSPPGLAAQLGRGARSGIGIATFELGGAVLDSGPRDGTLPQLIARVPFPEDWPMLLIFDPEAKGLDGSEEVAAFESLPAFPEAERADLEARILERALPAVQQRDFAVFCDEVGNLQRLMGAYFAPLQGGPFTSKQVEAVIETLRADGVTGLGQSSWGPTGFAFDASKSDGEALLKAARRADSSGALHFSLANARNQGAEIVLTPSGEEKNLGSTGA